MMPRRHLRVASNTPEPGYPLFPTGLISVENLFLKDGETRYGDITSERTVPSGTATITDSPIHGGLSQSCIRRMRRLTGSFWSSIERRVRSTCRNQPSLMAFAGNSTLATRTLGLVCET